MSWAARSLTGEVKQEMMVVTAPPISISYHDVVVIGGGVAGIAISEFLARRTSLRIKLIEYSPQLGMGASGKQEGWFHSGALYSGNDDPQTFLNCVNAIEDLINHYSSYFEGRCNMMLAEKKAGVFVPEVASSEDGWFDNRRTLYFLPTTESPDLKLSQLRSERILWAIQSKRVLNRLEAAFGLQHNWLKSKRCSAPHYEEVEGFRYKDGACSLVASLPQAAELCSKFDRSYGLNDSHYSILNMLDCPMNATRIMSDLTASALSRGVQVETGVTVEQVILDPSRSGNIKSLLCRDQRNYRTQIKARVFVFAIGAGFEALARQLNLPVRVKVSRSCVIVANPPLSTVNFVRMSPRDRFHFNHFMHANRASGKDLQFSFLANSNFSRGGPDPEQFAAQSDMLLDTAARYFGDEELSSRKLFSYEGLKAEFVSDEEEKRRYSYWIEFNDKTNCMYVVPGKFSFFPTLAYQCYLRLKSLLDLKETREATKYTPDPDREEQAKALVAEHYAVRLLSPK